MNLRDLKKLDKREILNMLGVESKDSTAGRLAGILGTLGVGLLVGTGVGLILAPKLGWDLHGKICSRLRSIPEGLCAATHGIAQCDRAAGETHNHKG